MELIYHPRMGTIEVPLNQRIHIPSPNYFSPSWFYCIETIYTPCMVVIDWTKFDKSKSPTNILNFLGSVYPTEESQPAYICIDKACQVLQTAVTDESWDMWKRTTRSIVDTYHYINHQVLDNLCRKYCNQSLGDGSPPILVVIGLGPKWKPICKMGIQHTGIYSSHILIFW
jgi:hypothetical protein